MRIINSMKDIWEVRNALKLYGRYYAEYRKIIRQLCNYYKYKKGYRLAIWGAGLKGKAFLRVIDPKQIYIDCCYDIDLNKTGKILPTGHMITDYSQSDKDEVQIILLMNGNFETETAALLTETGIKAIVINVDNLIIGEFSAKEIVMMYKEQY